MLPLGRGSTWFPGNELSLLCCEACRFGDWHTKWQTKLYWFGKTVCGKHALNTGRGGCGREGDLAAVAVTPLISRVDSADLTG